ncbi:hypothetical protein [Bacillus cereus]|uniref:hypothetical protein n=1 Tax=Bacillus cereus TaxID=1396 RepID=UPI003CEAE0E7
MYFNNNQYFYPKNMKYSPSDNVGWYSKCFNGYVYKKPYVEYTEGTNIIYVDVGKWQMTDIRCNGYEYY